MIPTAELVEPAPVRSPATLDRAATLRWLVGAAACLGDLLDGLAFRRPPAPALPGLGMRGRGVRAQRGAGARADRRRRRRAVRVYLPGRAPAWGPSLDDLLESPSTALLRRLDDPAGDGRPALETIALVPERPFLFGTMMGGPVRFSRWARWRLPLALAIVLHVLSPRGSRESLSARLEPHRAGEPGRALWSSCCLEGRSWSA